MQNTAPVYSLADEQRARSESAAWARFTAPGDATELYAAWLALLAGRIQRSRAALLLTRESADGAFSVAAAWPDPRRDLQYLSPVAQRALQAREGVVAAPGGEGPPGADGLAHVGYPIEVAGELCGAVVFDLGPGPLADLQTALRDIHWAAAWLTDHFRQQVLAAREAELARVALFNEAMATAMQHTRLQPSALAVANELAQRLRCDRVSVGFEAAGQVTPLVMSNTATFDQRFMDFARVWTDGSVWPRHPGRGRAASWLPPDAPADSGWRARLAREAAPVYGHVVGHNDETVGIELAHSGRSGDAFPERQVRSLAWLLRSLLDLSDGRLSPADVRGHKDLDRRVAYCSKERAGQPVCGDEAGRPYRRRVDPPESVWAGLRLAGLDVPRPPGDLDADLRRAEALAEGVRPACAAR